MSPNTQAYIGLGANLGDAQANLLEALRRIAQLKDVSLENVSSFYRTAPVDAAGPDYVNAVASVQTSQTAENLLHELLTIESAMGRVRPSGVAHAPRTIDLDLLMYGNLVCDSRFLSLPHPRMHERAFVLVPLLEIAPNLEIPRRGRAWDYLPLVGNQVITRMDVESGRAMSREFVRLSRISSS